MSSYKGKFGYVRYYVRAVLDKPSQHALQCEREFEVEEPLDVNRPDLLVRNTPTRPADPVSGSAESDFSFLVRGPSSR